MVPGRPGHGTRHSAAPSLSVIPWPGPAPTARAPSSTGGAPSTSFGSSRAWSTNHSTCRSSGSAAATGTCSDGTYWHYYPDLTGFPLRAGAFGDAFSYSTDMDAGAKRRFSYDLHGRVTKTSAHGTLHATTADTDATGAQTMTCDSGTIAWKALTG